MITSSELIDDLAESIETEAFITQAKRQMQGNPNSASSAHLLKILDKVHFRDSKKRLRPGEYGAPLRFT
jgi:hypothetical protein